MVERDQSREGARAAALRLLGRRPLTVEELRLRLERRGFDPAESAAALDALGREGWIDDHELALHYIVVRAERLGHGRERLCRELVGRGVPAEIVERAWSEALQQGRLEPERLLARQASLRVEREGGRLDLRAYRRVYNSLLRAGFEAPSIRTQLEPYIDFADDAEAVVADGLDHDLA
jgi:SOS response regulatory protein OraA/RecX